MKPKKTKKKVVKAWLIVNACNDPTAALNSDQKVMAVYFDSVEANKVCQLENNPFDCEVVPVTITYEI